MICDICSKERDERTGECDCTANISESEFKELLAKLSTSVDEMEVMEDYYLKLANDYKSNPFSHGKYNEKAVAFGVCAEKLRNVIKGG